MSIPIKIPIVDGAPLPFFDLQIVLESITYTLQFRWNVRLAAWFMDVLNEAGDTYLIAGVRIVVGWPLAAYRNKTVPPGQFIALDTVDGHVDPQLTDFGLRVKLWYLTAAELGLV